MATTQQASKQSYQLRQPPSPPVKSYKSSGDLRVQFSVKSRNHLHTRLGICCFEFRLKSPFQNFADSLSGLQFFGY